jgi:hypothetical protein
LIQDWEKKQAIKKSCFVTISDDLHIVENITDVIAKSPEIDVGLDLVEVGKGESMTALDMFINTELADVQEIKQGLSILSKALTSPGLVRYHIYIKYLSFMFLKISVLSHSSLDLMLAFFSEVFRHHPVMKIIHIACKALVQTTLKVRLMKLKDVEF